MVKMRPLAGVFALLIFFALVQSCVGDTEEKTVVVFKGGETDVSYKEASGAITKHKPRDFRVPAFVGGVLDRKEFLAVFSDAHYSQSEGLPFIEPALRTSKENFQSWSDAVTFGRSTASEKGNVLRNITAVMKGKKIYALATSLKTANDFEFNRRGGTLTTEWDIVMFVGTVAKATDSSGDSFTVTWEKEKSLKDMLPEFLLGYHATHFVGGVGNGVVMKNGTIVLPIQIKNGNPSDQYNQASSIIYSSDNGTTWHMGKHTPKLATSEGSVVEWSDGKLLLSVRFDFGYRVVYETDDMGATWKEFPPFTRVWGNHPDVSKYLGSQGSAITVPVDGKNILLVSHPQITQDTRTRETLQLWVSDGKRISCVGTISEDKGEQTGNSILALVGEKLYVTHEINPFGNLSDTDPTPGEWDKVIAVSSLQDFFESAKNTVNKWQGLDTLFQSKGIPADGLVGVLGNTEENSEVWEDVYNCVNATVKNAQSVEEGFRFSGSRDSYALWPVDKQGQNQVYKFTDKQFTLVATVIIHSTSEGNEVSVFGVGEVIHSNSLLFGLGYTEDKKWCLMLSNGNKKITQYSFDLGTEYQIAITFANVVDIVYVNGVKITNGEQRAQSAGSVDFFFMGGTGSISAQEGSSCTVKNVMLFNRALSQAEIPRPTNADQQGKQQEPKTPTTTTTTTSTTVKPEPVSTTTTTTTRTPVNSASVSTTTSTSAPVGSASVSTTTTTTTTVKPEPVSTTTTTTTTVKPKPVSTTTTTTTTVKPKPVSTTTTTTTTVKPEPVLTTTTTSTTVKPEPVLTTTTSTVTPVNHETVLTTTNTEGVENDKSVSTTELKEISASVLQKVANGEGSGRKMNNSLHKYHDMAFEKYAEGDSASVVALSAVAWMSLVCSFIVLA